MYFQGDLSSQRDGLVFLTIHDIGSNHKPIAKFSSLPCMEDITARALFVHVCVPGQDKDAEDFGADFPSMQVWGQIHEFLMILFSKLNRI